MHIDGLALVSYPAQPGTQTNKQTDKRTNKQNDRIILRLYCPR